MAVVIPTLNEAQNLPHVLGRIPTWVREVIVVDGLSIDDTIAVVRDCRPDARVVLNDEPGKGRALWSGFEAATSDIIVALDGDGSTDPREIPLFVGALVAGSHVVFGSRFALGGGTSDMERHRKLGNHGLRLLVRLLFDEARYSDLCYGYMAFWRDVIPLLDGPSHGFEFETAVHIRAVKCGLRVAEVPSYEFQRLSGASNLRAVRDGWSVFRTIVREWAAPSSVRSWHGCGQTPRSRAVIGDLDDRDAVVQLLRQLADLDIDGRIEIDLTLPDDEVVLKLPATDVKSA